VPMVQASWQLSASIAAVLLIGYGILTLVDLPRLSMLRNFCLQFGVVVAVFAVYQHTAHYAYSHVDGADQRARQIWDVERAWHLPSELTIQHWVLPHPFLVRGLNLYYAGLHLTGMTAFLVWMWWRHRAYYLLACVTVAGTTLICVSLQHIPVAPPRLMPGLGFVDTGLVYGQSVYGPNGTGIADQLAAMPSIHVAWAGIIAGFAVVVSRSRWRWLLVLHFAMTFVVVVATANHWWLDGVVGLVIAAVVFAVARLALPTPSPHQVDLGHDVLVDHEMTTSTP
jgi:hypothetical protein